MTTAAGESPWLGTTNPFPAAAVARVSDQQLDYPTIVTPAVKKLRQQVDAYLAATRAADEETDPATGPGELRLMDSGCVIAVVGEYGSGKTHLAMDILAQIDRSRLAGRAETRSIYHAVPGSTFLDFYTDLMDAKVNRNEVRERVTEFYASVVAEALRGRPFTDGLVRQLETGEIHPQVVVDRFGLMEGGLLRELRRRLSSVTDRPAFCNALMLLLRAPLELRAWEWLCGGAPDEVLKEHGISERIETDAWALEALGVLALLYGVKNRRFVLIIDEMEKIVLSLDRSPAESTQAFKHLLEVFRSAGAMLVSCGLPDIFDVLPQDTGRIDATIVPSELTAEDVSWYIKEIQGKAFGRRTLEPFDDESVEYLVRVSGGVAREVVKLCYHSYELAAATGREVMVAMVHDAARSRFRDTSLDLVRSELVRIIGDEGWEIFPDWELDGNRVDFWVPVGEDGAGCALFVSDVILQQQEAEGLAARARGVRSSSPRRETLLLISGYLAPETRFMLTEAYGRPPFVYDVRRFSSDFLGEFYSVVNRIAYRPQENPLAESHKRSPAASEDVRTLRDQTAQIKRQQSHTLRLVRELADRLDAARAESDDRLDALKRAIETGPGTGGAGAAEPGRGLPNAIAELFDRARRSLAAFGDVRALIDSIFSAAARTPGASGRSSLIYQLRASNPFDSVGVAQLLSDILESFQASVAEWLGSLDYSSAPAPPSAAARAELREICRTFESLYGAIPLFQLDELADLTGPAETGTLLGRSTRASRRTNLRDAFDGLGERVYNAAITVAERETGAPRKWRSDHLTGEPGAAGSGRK